jgi:hypothetical protein
VNAAQAWITINKDDNVKMEFRNEDGTPAKDVESPQSLINDCQLVRQDGSVAE